MARDRALEEARAGLAKRLRARRRELEQAIATRVWAIAPPRETADLDYLQGLYASLTAAVDHATITVECGERRASEVPAVLLAQARMAAREQVTLDTVLRRYIAGYSLFTDSVLESAKEADLFSDEALKEILRDQATVFDRLLQAVSDEYRRAQATRLHSSPRRRRVERVRRLLAGEPIDPGELNYELDVTHVGAIAVGPRAPEVLRELSTQFDRHLLLAQDEERTWAWLGSRQPMEESDRRLLADSAEALADPGVVVAFGEPAGGCHGWRLTHQQATVALAMAQRLERRVVCYADVALLASVTQNALLMESLRRIYLDPLSDERDGGEAIRQALRAYFAAGRNISSAAASLDLNRQTVRTRLRIAEEKLGCSLDQRAAEIEVALRLDYELEPRSPHLARTPEVPPKWLFP